MTLYIGIDPGLNGALGWIAGDHAGIIDAATAEVRVGRAKRRDYLPAAMAGALAELCARWRGHEPRAVLERVHSMPADGGVQAFAFGRGVGIWEGILSALFIPYETVETARWRKGVGLSVRAQSGETGAERKRIQKSESRVYAAMQFPALADKLVRVKDDGRAEALLMARWLQKQEEK